MTLREKVSEWLVGWLERPRPPIFVVRVEGRHLGTRGRKGIGGEITKGNDGVDCYPRP